MDIRTWQQRALHNRLQSLLLLAAMSGLSALLGWLLWGNSGVYTLLLITVVFFWLSPSISPALIMRMYRAQPLTPQQAPQLFSLLGELAHRAGLPAVPVLYYVPSSMVNAFAVGNRSRAAIAVTDGLLRTLDLREAAGVLAHEISHIQNNDLWIMGIADFFSRLTSTLSFFGQLLLFLNLPLILFSDMTINWWVILLLIAAPTISAIAQLGLSRTREYEADLNAVRLTGDPAGLAGALAKIAQTEGAWIRRVLQPGRGIPDPSLLRTHPSTEERIKRLMSLQASPSLPIFRQPPDIEALLADVLLHPVAHRPRRRPGGLWY